MSAPEYHLNPNHGTTNTSHTNSTSSCPTFLAGFNNATVSYCALPICANTTAVMTQCCRDSPVSPYHSVGGSDFHGVENFTDLNALWCQVDNSSFGEWMSCVDVPVIASCSDPASIHVQEGWASRGFTTGLKTTVGLALMVAVFHCML
ncbi:hypothetical protein Q7P35_000320 [Cladosporium inversicolor]